MIIRKIKMENFRGFRNKTINFDDKSVVLLSAANGIGKTTTIDAIEWCLTGSIGRLKTAFDTRSTNDADRKMNNDGILKNRNAGEKDIVRVFLWLTDGENETCLCREQKNDELNPEISKVTMDENEAAAKKFIQEYVGDSFYNLHFCDVQKSFNIQSKKRKDLKDFFGEFITNYDEKKQIAANLEVFAEDVDRYIEDKMKQKVPQEIIKEREDQLAKTREEARQIPYPAILFYPNEIVEITLLNKEELTAQKENLVNCGYQVASSLLSKLVENEKLKNQKSILEWLASYWKTNENTIHQAFKVGFFKNTDATASLKMRLKKLNDLHLARNTILQDGESVIAIGIKGFTKSDFNSNKELIKEKEKKVKELSDEIELITKNNKMLMLLSHLSANRQVMIEYRDTAIRKNKFVQCPVCGSESFSTMTESLILKEAENYIKQNGEIAGIKESQIASLKEEINILYQEIIERIKNAVEKERQTLQTDIRNLKDLKDKIQPYLSAVTQLQQVRTEINADDLTAEKICELLIIVESTLFEEYKEQEIRNSYQQILTVLGHKFENETIHQTFEKVKNLASKSFKVSDFAYDVFVSKLNAIDSILANQTLSDLHQKVEEYNRKNQILDAEIKELQVLKDIASQRAENIRDIVEKLSKEEYEKVGPALGKFYNKLARFNSSDGINIVQEKDGISLVDSKGKNIVNVLSNGQISVFMLAHFFAGINVRNRHEKMRVYFIDDLTSCMDDVNMLAFMDLLKYQMSAKATMDQLFFITCDERISKLLKYKLNGRGIELCELLETDFAQGGPAKKSL